MSIIPLLQMAYQTPYHGGINLINKEAHYISVGQ